MLRVFSTALLISQLTCTVASAQSRFDVTASDLQKYAAQATKNELRTGEEDHNFAFDNANARKAADIASWVAVISEAGWFAERSWNDDPLGKKHSAICAASKVAATSLTVRITKWAVGRERPDGSNNQSFPSGHTAFASLLQNSGWTGFFWPIGIGTARVVGEKHWPTDVIAGGLIGYLIRWSAAHFGDCVG